MQAEVCEEFEQAVQRIEIRRDGAECKDGGARFEQTDQGGRPEVLQKFPC